jgi:hypothetical protein
MRRASYPSRAKTVTTAVTPKMAGEKNAVRFRRTMTPTMTAIRATKPPRATT